MKHPRLYPLLFAARLEGGDLKARRAELVGPLVGHLSGLVGPDRALDAARLLTAFVHGFVTMELNGSFQMGGDVEQSFAFGVARLSASLHA